MSRRAFTYLALVWCATLAAGGYWLAGPPGLLRVVFAILIFAVLIGAIVAYALLTYERGMAREPDYSLQEVRPGVWRRPPMVLLTYEGRTFDGKLTEQRDE